MQEQEEGEVQQQNNNQGSEHHIPTVSDPERANTKGRSKRIKGHFEGGKNQNNKKTKAMQAKGDTREFGTITPTANPKLF